MHSQYTNLNSQLSRQEKVRTFSERFPYSLSGATNCSNRIVSLTECIRQPF